MSLQNLYISVFEQIWIPVLFAHNFLTLTFPRRTLLTKTVGWTDKLSSGLVELIPNTIPRSLSKYLSASLHYQPLHAYILDTTPRAKKTLTLSFILGSFSLSSQVKSFGCNALRTSLHPSPLSTQTLWNQSSQKHLSCQSTPHLAPNIYIYITKSFSSHVPVNIHMFVAAKRQSSLNISTSQSVSSPTSWN